MSAQPHDAPHAADEVHAIGFDEEDVLGDDEPRTPGWLTGVGVALFLGAGVWWIASRPAAPTMAEMAAAAASASAAAAAAQPLGGAQPAPAQPAALRPLPQGVPDLLPSRGAPPGGGCGN